MNKNGNTFFKRLLFSLGLLSVVNVSVYAQSTGETLFLNKCVTCHTMTMPSDKSQLVAPPARGLMYHLAEEKGSDENIKNHIESFTMNPTKEEAICRSVRRFGVMPSQKGNITESELKIVSQWMVDNLKMDAKQHQKREKGRCKSKD